MNQSLIISRVFWIVFVVEVLVWVAALTWTPSGGRGYGPEGPVGGWLIDVVPPLFLAIPLAVVLFGRFSKTAYLVGLYLVLSPLVPLIIGPIYGAWTNFRTERSVAGDLNFLRPSQRKLAHALRAHDADLVKSLLPNAGDLNTEHRGESLFAFGLTNADKSAASVEIVKAMLDRGANPNLVTSNRTHALTFVIVTNPALTKLLLDAGANPNYREGSASQPVWWDVLYNPSPESVETLRYLLDHGANVGLRDSNGGCVGRAAYFKAWRLVWLLMERGAAWKDERVLGERPVAEQIDQEVASLRAGKQPIPEEMLKIKARYDAGR